MLGGVMNADTASLFPNGSRWVRADFHLHTVADVASNRIREPLYPLAEVVRVEGKNVLVVTVAESESKPTSTDRARSG